MSAQGATLQNYTNMASDLLDSLTKDRKEVHEKILEDEVILKKMQNDITEMQTKFNEKKSEYAQKLNTRKEFDKAIREAEAQYMKVLEHSQVLLKMMKQGQSELSKLKSAISTPTSSDSSE
tara:strand:+ start:182 stop:544 length:363 start_codon:yes stop_codon:yes gene_type:complete